MSESKYRFGLDKLLHDKYGRACKALEQARFFGQGHFADRLKETGGLHPFIEPVVSRLVGWSEYCSSYNWGSRLAERRERAELAKDSKSAANALKSFTRKMRKTPPQLLIENRIAGAISGIIDQNPEIWQVIVDRGEVYDALDLLANNLEHGATGGRGAFAFGPIEYKFLPRTDPDPIIALAIRLADELSISSLSKPDRPWGRGRDPVFIDGLPWKAIGAFVAASLGEFDASKDIGKSAQSIKNDVRV